MTSRVFLPRVLKCSIRWSCGPLSSPLNSMSFVKLSIFGTSFEVRFPLFSFISLTRSQVTTRYVDLQPVGMGPSSPLIPSSLSRSPSQRCFRPSMVRLPILSPLHSTNAPSSSAKDQLTGASVAIKKIMKPFSTPVLSKRTYRELKLLKHIQHENVRPFSPPLPYFPLPIPSLARSSA